jgi:hypothetical protein
MNCCRSCRSVLRLGNVAILRGLGKFPNAEANVKYTDLCYGATNKTVSPVVEPAFDQMCATSRRSGAHRTSVSGGTKYIKRPLSTGTEIKGSQVLIKPHSTKRARWRDSDAEGLSELIKSHYNLDLGQVDWGAAVDEFNAAKGLCVSSRQLKNFASRLNVDPDDADSRATKGTRGYRAQTPPCSSISARPLLQIPITNLLTSNRVTPSGGSSSVSSVSYDGDGDGDGAGGCDDGGDGAGGCDDGGDGAGGCDDGGDGAGGCDDGGDGAGIAVRLISRLPTVSFADITNVSLKGSSTSGDSTRRTHFSVIEDGVLKLALLGQSNKSQVNWTTVHTSFIRLAKINILADNSLTGSICSRTKQQLKSRACKLKL